MVPITISLGSQMQSDKIHDINSALNSLALSFELLSDDPALLEELAPLLKKKIVELNATWSALKESTFSK